MKTAATNNTTATPAATHTPGPWRVMADPQYAGKHMFHDSRWITTADAELTFGYDPRSWALEKGSLICEMRDGPSSNARLIAAAPDLLVALQTLLANATAKARYVSLLEGKDCEECELPDTALDSPEMTAARAAIAKATGA